MPSHGKRPLVGQHGALIRRLIARRHELGIGSRHLDQQLGFADGLVSKWEAGIYSPSLFNLCCWCDALGVHLAIAEGRKPTEPMTERAYQVWLKRTGRTNTMRARKLFKGLVSA